MFYRVTYGESEDLPETAVEILHSAPVFHQVPSSILVEWMIYVVTWLTYPGYLRIRNDERSHVTLYIILFALRSTHVPQYLGT